MMRNLEPWPTDKFGILWKPDEFDSDDLDGLFDRLESAMDTCGAPRDQILLPGASEDEIRSTLSSLPVNLHDHVVRWFQWTRGPIKGSNAALMSSMSPIDLGEVVPQWHFFEEGTESPWYEFGRWVPILHNGAIDCGADERRGTIVDVAPHGLEYNRIPGLAVLLWSWIGVRENGLHPWRLDLEERRAAFFELFPVMQNRVEAGLRPMVNF